MDELKKYILLPRKRFLNEAFIKASQHGATLERGSSMTLINKP